MHEADFVIAGCTTSCGSGAARRMDSCIGLGVQEFLQGSEPLLERRYAVLLLLKRFADGCTLPTTGDEHEPRQPERAAGCQKWHGHGNRKAEWDY
jgi:hypothetical protein